MDDRILLAHLDTIDFPSVFLGAIKAGIVPIAANTLLTTADYRFMLEDSRAQALIVSEALLPNFEPLLKSLPFLKHVIVSGKDPHGHAHLQSLMAKAGTGFADRAHDLRRRVLLALFFGLDRHAERDGPRSFQPDPDRRAVRQAGPGHS